MKINKPYSINPGQLYQTQQKRAKEIKNIKNPQNDKVEISNEAKKIKELAKKTMSLPDIRHDKVDELKSQIEKDQYTVTPEQIVKSMLENI